MSGGYRRYGYLTQVINEEERPDTVYSAVASTRDVATTVLKQVVHR